MTDKVIIYMQSNGRTAVCVPALDDRRLLTFPGREPMLEPEDAWFSRVIKRSVPADATDIKIVPRSSIPSDRTFRDAWTHNGGQIDVDMPRARDIHRHRIRRARKALFRELDTAYQKADEADDSKAKAEIAKRKKQLRDAPDHPDIESARSPEQLKAVWPI